MAKEKDNVLFNVNRFEVKKGYTYAIKNKLDLNAPSGFVNEGSTKLPDGVDESFQCRCSPEGLWDSGFFDWSPCFSTLDPTEAKVKAKANLENVAKPFMRVKGIKDNDTLDPNNDAWWKLQDFKIWHGRIYNTDNPVDAFELYMAINAYQLTPKEFEKDPKFSGSYYVIVDTTKAKKLKEERTETKFSAISKFSTVLDANKSALIDILFYLDIKVDDKSSSEALMTLFDEHILPKEDKLRMFVEAVSDISNDNLEKYIIYRKLNGLYGSTVTRKSNGTFAYDGVEIGQDLKSAADFIAKNPKLEDIKNQIILREDAN